MGEASYLPPEEREVLMIKKVLYATEVYQKPTKECKSSTLDAK